MPIRLRPGAPVACGIGVQMVVDNQRRTMADAAQFSDNVRAAFALGCELHGETHLAQLVGDQDRDSFLPSGRLVRIKRVLRLRLAGRDEFASELEARLARRYGQGPCPPARTHQRRRLATRSPSRNWSEQSRR